MDSTIHKKQDVRETKEKEILNTLQPDHIPGDNEVLHLDYI
jgi:hypothetical protein